MHVRRILLVALLGLVVGGVLGFLQPLYSGQQDPEPAEKVDLPTYVAAHPLQGACIEGAEPTVSLFWSLPEEVTVNRLRRSAAGGGEVPIFQGKIGRDALFSEFIDKDVVRGQTYVYQVETDAGLKSNRVTITVSPEFCNTQP